jgi:diguanylate cyclase
VFHSLDDAENTVELLANRVTTALRIPFEIGELNLELSCSIGAVEVPEHGDEPSLLVKFADLAMYQAKNNGKDQFVEFTRQMGAAHLRRLELYSGLREALRARQLCVYYQPRVLVDSGRIYGAEALARWRNDDGSFVEPSLFIPVAEETGLIHELGAIVMREAFEFAVSANHTLQSTDAPFVVSVNVSGFQLRYNRFVEQTEVLLEVTGCDARWVEFEITESRMVLEPQLLARLHELVSRLGIRCSLDDFGTGFSNLGELSVLPISTLKIDRSFIQNLSQDNSAVVSAIIALAQSLSLTTVAEGVETPEQLKMLQRLGCASFQGYLHSRAVPDDEFSATYFAQSG